MMASIHTKEAGAAYRITAFGGIDRRGEIRDMQNLRPQADGSLKRRCGYALALTLGATVRGVWSGSFRGEEAVFAAAGDGLFRLRPDLGQASRIGSIAAGTGRVALFLWRGKLCCMDGQSIYLWDGGSFAPIEPYVPLVARERDPFDTKSVYEPINLLSRRARFSFRGDGISHNFLFGYAIEAIESVYDITGSFHYSVTGFSLHIDPYGNHFMQLNPAPAEGHILLAMVRLDARYDDRARIAACTRAEVWGGSYDDRVLCWGGGAASEMFCSRPVTASQVAEAAMWNSTVGEMYFPLDCNFHVGDGRYPLRAVCRSGDRLLIFTAGDAWEANFTASDSDRLPVTPINSGVGCTAPGGAVQAGNDPLTVSDGAVWRWSAHSQRRDECSATAITAGLGEPFGGGFDENALVHGCRARNEVWFADPTDPLGQVYIYHTVLDAWYRFSGIAAAGFFSWRGDVGFWRGSSFYCFDEARECDLEAEGESPIAARLVFDGLDFGSTERFDHLTRFGLHLDGPYPDMALIVETDRRRADPCIIPAGGEADRISLYQRPFRSGRFRRLRLTLTTTARTRLHLRGIVLTAEPGER